MGFKKFLFEYESKVIGLSKELSLAYFNATITGKKEDYEKASILQMQLNTIYADKDDFKILNDFKKSGLITEPVLKRQLDLIYNEYASNQFNEELMKEIIELSTSVEEKFSTFRVKTSGKELTDNQVDDILINSTNPVELENIWKASRQCGRLVVNDVIKLAELRNESARLLGYKNYYEMSLTLSEQNITNLEKLFDELDLLTRDSFALLKTEIDKYLSNRLNIPVESLMPWYYQDKFFQNGPKIYNVTLDSYYKDKDLVKITADFYKMIGLDINSIIEKSDLFEKEGKYQHAYCTDIDRCGDIRVVCNIKPNHKWMSAQLHEFGHAVYDKYINSNLPWQLRTHSHVFTTEAIAMFFGRLSSNPDWLETMLGITSDEKNIIAEDCYKSFRLEQLVFSRWVQVMFRFEKSLYENPRQDLNKLWWELVEKYQLLKKPEGWNEPDWAAKIHISLYPAYYHNYMLGELLASQLHYCISNNNQANSTLKYLCNNSTGTFLKNNIFYHGAGLRWDELIKSSTGEPLSPRFYAMEIVNNIKF